MEKVRDNSALPRNIIMTTGTRSLIIQAGPRALQHLLEHGLRPGDIDIVPGAAGGPKGLGLARPDEYLFADWLTSGFADDYEGRLRYWRFSINESERLAEAFRELCASDHLVESIRPI